jgi:uncharacterized membrane protein YdbT with pleckstrin-like domain
MGETPDDVLRFEARRHGIVLARPLLRALLLALLGAACFLGPWPLSVAGAVALAAAAVWVLAAVVRWDRTQVVLTRDELVVVHGVVRRSQASVRLSRVGPVEVEQSLLGRLLGYGTIVAGDLEIDYVPKPKRVSSAIGRLAG